MFGLISVGLTHVRPKPGAFRPVLSLPCRRSSRVAERGISVELFFSELLRSIPGWEDGLTVQLNLGSRSYPISNVFPVGETGMLCAVDAEDESVHHIFSKELLDLTVRKH